MTTAGARRTTPAASVKKKRSAAVASAMLSGAVPTQEEVEEEPDESVLVNCYSLMKRCTFEQRVDEVEDNGKEDTVLENGAATQRSNHALNSSAHRIIHQDHSVTHGVSQFYNIDFFKLYTD